MTTASPSVSWHQAFSLLSSLALNTMFQPVGRVLGSSAVNSFWLRTSPIVCALDTLTLIVRLLAYRMFLGTTLRKALLIVGEDRFDEHEVNYGSRRTTIMTTLRHVGFFLSILSPIYMVGSWGQTRWTVAWIWMYIASYIMLEIASQLARQELSRPDYTAMDFELESLGEADDDDASLAENEASDQPKPMEGKTQDESENLPSARYTQGNDSSHEGRMNDEIDDYTIDEMDFMPSTSTENLLRNTSFGGQNVLDNVGYRLTQEEPTEPAPRTCHASDLVAARDSNNEYDDLLTSERFSNLKDFFNFLDLLILRWGCLFHGILVYWAFLDLIHPPLHTYFLTSYGWGVVIVFLRIPFLMVAMTLIAVASWFVANGLATGMAALMRLVGQYLPCTIDKGWVGRLLFIVALAAVGAGLYGGGFGPYWVLVQLFVVGDFTQKIYSLLAVEIVVLLIFLSVCFGLRRLLRFTAQMTADARQRFEALRHFAEDGATLVTCVIVTFTVSTVWYRFRFPSSTEWVENWREALLYNTTLLL